MKKSLVVVALAGAMAFTAASAETVLYGSIRMGMDVGKNHYGAQSDVWGNNIGAKRNKRGIDMQDYGSRLGLKGSEDLGNGMTVLYQLEWGFDGMASGQNGKGAFNRLAWVGISGDWGTVALGRQNNPFTESLNAGTEADELNGDLGTISALRYATGTVMMSSAGDNIEDFDAMPTRVGKSIAYVSPTWSGFNFVLAGIAEAPENVGYVTNASNRGMAYNSSKGFDIYTVGLNYEHESGFYAKAAYLGADLVKDNKRANTYGLNVGFKNEQFGVNADFGGGSRGRKATTDFAGNTLSGSPYKVSSTGWDLGAHFSFGPDYFSTIRATFGQAQVKYKGDRNEFLGTGEATKKNKMTVWAVGFEQKLSTRTKVWVEYAKENRKVFNDANNVDAWGNQQRTKDNRDTVSIGIRHDF
ncbi:porin [Wohlfahrtiimonas larvae]|uniref:Porin Omp38 n=1 Tax=Wohlfahrtiimonas larvae TaxID=1157986 RepID=A0ABP9MGV1_9GAMM